MTYVIVTTSIAKRTKIIKDLREKLTVAVPPGYQYKVVQSQVNKIEIMQFIKENEYIPVRKYVVVIIPVIVSFEPLKEFYGDVYFDSTDLLNELYCAIGKLKTMQGPHMRSNKNEKFEGLAQSLLGISE